MKQQVNLNIDLVSAFNNHDMTRMVYAFGLRGAGAHVLITEINPTYAIYIYFYDYFEEAVVIESVASEIFIFTCSGLFNIIPLLRQARGASAKAAFRLRCADGRRCLERWLGTTSRSTRASTRATP